MLTRTFFHRAPLTDAPLAPLPAGAVCALGQSRDRLTELRAGLLDRAPSLYPGLTRDSSFFGGDGPAGSEVARWLEAMLLTSALLSDRELERDALHYITLCLEHQGEDGLFGPGATFKARGCMLRTVFTAYTLTGDRHCLTFMLRYFKALQNCLQQGTLPGDAPLHLSNTLQAGIDLYNITGQRAILSVLNQLLAVGMDFTTLYHSFPYRLPISRQFTEEELLAPASPDAYVSRLLKTADGENLCEGLRTVALSGVITGSAKQLQAAERGFAQLFRQHGAVCGGLTADPLLAGTHPSRGVSTPALCELSASFEALFACPEGAALADAWERVMYNAVPAAFAPDGRSVQRMQQSNQVRLDQRKRFPLSMDTASLFTLKDPETLFALLPAIPRFLSRQWMLTRDDGLCAMGYAPCQVRYRLGGAAVHLSVEGNYPEGGQVRIRLSLNQDAAFPLRLRMPQWCQRPSAAVKGDVVYGKPGTFLVLNRQWHDGDEILLTLPMAPRTEETYHHAVCITRGPLLFALAPEEFSENDGAVLRAAEDFAYALLTDTLAHEETENGPRVRVQGIPVPLWGERDGSCDQPPADLPKEETEPRNLVLVPYAGTRIRISVFPAVPSGR